jgi:magnesium-transporting ATPase (P-type)
MEKYLGYGRKFLTSFTAIFTCIILASTIFIGIYSNPYVPFRLIMQSLILSAVSALLNFIYYSEKPIHKRVMAVRTVIHFCLVLAMVLVCAWQFNWFSFGHLPSVLTFFVMFLIVYTVVWLVSFMGDLLDEWKINKRLNELYSSPAGNGRVK